MVKSKRIYLNTKNTNYCIVKLFGTKLEMQVYYKKHCGERHLPDTGQFKVKGVSLHYETWVNEKVTPQTGMVLLCLEECGAGVVSHELLHAVLYAYKFKKNKKQYPIVINNMKEEEIILHNLTNAVSQFYRWFWKINDKFP